MLAVSDIALHNLPLIARRRIGATTFDDAITGDIATSYDV